jgi:hypothetical protein
MKHVKILSLTLATLLFAGAANAAVIVFNINANGAKEVTAGGVPNQGDLDGTAIGTLALDSVAGSATINLTLANVDLTTLSGHHIHQAPATTNGLIVLDFGDPDTIRTGALLSGVISGLNTTTITNILATPSGFYYNLHNGAFPAGAVRDQLSAVPEPSTHLMGLMALVCVAVLRWVLARQ